MVFQRHRKLLDHCPQLDIKNLETTPNLSTEQKTEPGEWDIFVW